LYGGGTDPVFQVIEPVTPPDRSAGPELVVGTLELVPVGSDEFVDGDVGPVDVAVVGDDAVEVTAAVG
jgi:hypothetical protein